ncbi:nuclear transport factor 2 family protein [Dactylosporangium sp. AC04546]|uniref:nuclear transport factor 2 family protein n=1 Tax=Dactylosporangium sp. AC04546 TaxID=2862460 RepID=UPI001EE13C5A|nr:nuclear transport factor 2 family protein [Dactylosporangium sp. AC04546]WVK79876.1 nuclear transport factor 2 family protein [Dactylosporangium sp. AC04546]
MTATPAAVAAAYFEAWRTRDFARLRTLLDPTVTFDGPLGTADNADSFLHGIEGLSEVMTDIVVLHSWADGPDVATWFELHTRLSEPCQTVNWSHVEDGRITRVLVTFDPRGLIGG